MTLIGKKIGAACLAFMFSASFLLVGCGDEAAAPSTKVAVKAMKITRQDAPVTYSYPGQLKGTDEVQVHSRVSGSIVEKYFKGGSRVNAGDPLYRIDARQYESAVLEAEANLHRSESALRNSQEDLARNEMLWKDKAISEQSVTNKIAEVAANKATVESQRAALKKARENLDDTIVYAPMSGKVSMDDVAVGTYASAGVTQLVTIGTVDPINVQFSISETEYLNILEDAVNSGALERNDEPEIPKIKITLSNGFQYPLEGEITEIDRAFTDNSGSLTVKAILANPYDTLLPGMFARVGFVGVVEENALLVPVRSVQQLLDEKFVLVVGEDGKSHTKKVTLGEKVGSYYIVRSGLEAGDTVIVDGLTSLQSGMDVDATLVTAEDMGFSLKESGEVINKS